MRRFLSRVLPAMILVVFFLGADALLAAGSRAANSAILIQTFGWNSQRSGSPCRWYKLIGERAEDLAELGVTHAWLPPVTRSVSPQGYLPTDYYDLGSKESPTFYGTLDDLKQCLSKLNAAGISPLADIVINHRCAGKQDENGIWNVYQFPSGKAAWEKWAVVAGEYGGTGKADSGDNFQPAPDVDHANSQVQEDIIAWMNWLKTLGFKGWRYDFVKGFAPAYVGLYDSKTKPVFSVGELWTNMSYEGSTPVANQNPHRQQLCNWLDGAGKTVTVFDFTTKGILQEAVNGDYWRLRDSEGKASGLIGWWPQRAVTFLDNHDTGSQQNHWPFPGQKVMQGYAYILTHPGIPCLFWEHVYDWNLKAQIRKLTDIRRKFGIDADSKLEIVKAERGLYAAVIDGKVAVKLGWVDWSPDPAFKLLASGDQFAIWGK
ncbi:MAG TPA: alpha-amylase C-terminal beta-sheet domain-containing protein [Candidatus Ozemobacteraceae bacterium]|nr:alpha-amylase C-terminal beta-sheet domain-containing protein [Candidatus Ozemobacteraceae bacterium]